jgi:hypothetical protein
MWYPKKTGQSRETAKRKVLDQKTCGRSKEKSVHKNVLKGKDVIKFRIG